MYYKIFIIIFFAYFSKSISQKLQITEFMASNKGIVADNLGDASDWIELYNASPTTIDLKNYSLTDDKKDKGKFKFPELQLPPSAYHVIWASGEKRTFVKLPPDIDIKFKSAGMADGNYSFISINEEDRSLNQRGINLVVLSSTGEYIKSLAFDTYISFEESDSLAIYLKSLLPGQIVIFSIKDDASNSLTYEAREVIASLGSKKIYDLSYRDSWGMISIKGKGAVCECYRKMGDGEAKSDISYIHADFKLDSEGEYIGIYDVNENVIDSVTFGTQIADRSYGRIPSTPNKWAFLSKPSPGSANNNSQIRYGQVAPPVFSPSKSISSEPMNIMINSTDSTCKIYYSLDGSVPDSHSSLYDNKPLLITKSSVIRAYCSKDNYFDSDITTQTYIIKPYKTLNIVSLVTSPDNLWDPEYGIYTVGNDSTQPNYCGRGERWERPAIYSLIDINGKTMIHSDCGLRIHGGASRSIPKKSFRLYFGEPIDYYPKIIDSEDPPRQDVVILSGGGNDSVADPRVLGQAWSLIRDQLMMRLYEILGYPRVNKYPILLYLNGEYWGIYILSERINRQFLKNHVNIENADLIKDNALAEEGTLDHWEETIGFFSTKDFTITENYEKALELINVENFTDYYILNLFGANWDWPTHNIYCYSDIETKTKWNWLMWDADCSFLSTPKHNTFKEILFTKKNNEIFYNLIKNEKYRNFFINCISYILNNKITPERICSTIDSLALLIEAEIENETNRWGGSKTQWVENIRRIKNFAIERPSHFRNIMNAELNVGGQVYLRILNENMNQGVVKINGNQIEDFPFSGIYFANIPIQLEVQPGENFFFKTWGINQFHTEFTVNIKESDTLNLCLEFEEIKTFKKTKGTFEVIANYPNPFSTITNIKIFSIADTEIEIEIYNLNGQSVTSMREKINSGYNTITWDAKNKSGYRIPSGVYLYAISDSTCQKIKKVTLLR